ncbi:MAG: hypothetical protein COS88_04345, partial [Chloroflexi bacterium CG07_land_8_20_14_0_80_51_10]
MSPICGILSRSGEDVSARMTSMLHTFDSEGAADAWLVSNTTSKTPFGYDEQMRQISPTKQAVAQVSFVTREQPVEQPSSDPSGKLAIFYEGNLYNIKELRANRASDHKVTNGSAAETVAHLLEKTYQGDLGMALKQVSPILDGAYCLAASDGEHIMLMTDPVGLRPAFYAEDGDLIAFASNKKALWQIGLRNVKSLRAGMAASFSKKGVSLSEVHPLSRWGIRVTIDDPATAIDRYCLFLEEAVDKRMKNLKRVGVLVSGGVDSCLIAMLASDIAARQNIEVTAYTAGVSGAADIEYAERFAQESGLSHRVRRLSHDEIEAYIPKVVTAVEERDLVQIEAGIGIYAAVEMASEDGIRVIFSGQGPDELWGGYSWYPQVIAQEGYEGLQQRMWGDLTRADIETLNRENRIALAHRVEKVFPYVDTEVVKLAMSVSPQLKITSAEDKIGKRPHREAAKRLGLAAQYADRSKDAAQHGTGIHDVLDVIAINNGFTPELVKGVGYNSEEISEEKLASSTRYGYLY